MESGSARESLKTECFADEWFWQQMHMEKNLGAQLAASAGTRGVADSVNSEDPFTRLTRVGKHAHEECNYAQHGAFLDQ